MKLKPTQIILRILVSLLWLLPAVLLVITCWGKTTFAVDFDAIINTMTGPLAGSSPDTVIDGLKFCVPWLLVIIVLIVVTNIVLRKAEKKNKKTRAIKRMISVLGVFFLAGVLIFVNSSFQITRYLSEHGQLAALKADAANIENEDDGSFYSTNYVNPNDVKISSPKKKKNLIYIYVESLETSYADKASGGAQENINYMPKLTKLAQKNISFSNSDGLGGFHTMDGASWTIAAIMATSSGIPFELPVGTNSMDEQSSFCSGLTTLGDILEEQGYTQEFLCGSDSNFAGRKNYFEQHGNYQIFDLFTARAKGYVPADYNDGWWGYEDKYLFEIAKDEATRLASGDTPFNLTMLTVDLHHVGGKHCDKCGDKYSTNLENVIACNDAQITEFVSWCKKQSWYDDTTIVITGDHPRMDTQLVDGLEKYDRTIYNCFINSSVEAKRGTKNRELTTVDIFPTTLAALGYKIEGDRLGLGTNAFSNKETLAEKHGYDWLNEQAGISSSWYLKEFAPELIGLSTEDN